MIQQFLEYIMRGRKQAVWVAILFVFVPFLGWVSNVILALVTLRISILEGFYILLWISLPSVVFAAVEYPAHFLLYMISIIGSLLTWALASVLRATTNWRKVLFVMTGAGLLMLSLAYLLVPDIQGWLLLKLQEFISLAKQKGTLDISEPVTTDILKPLIMNATGIMIAGISISALSNVGIARWCQASLYNPGGFKQELYELKLDKVSAIVFIALLATTFIQNAFVIDSVTIICLPLVLIGINLVHILLDEQKYANWVLIFFYGLLVISFPLMAKLLLVLALLDGLIDFRKKLKGVM